MSTPGAQLGRYRVEAILGAGAFGTVVRAHDALLNEHVALKVLRAELSQDKVALERLRREVLTARRVDHPNVCRLHDLQHHEGQPFIVMELVEGPSLDTILQDAPLPPARAVRVLEQVCRALAAAHAVDVLHRDVKPSNVMVKAGDDVRLVDFGIATMQGLERLTRPGIALGSMGYIAPELWAGKTATTASDVFAAGILTYVTLTRRLPWQAQGLQLLQQMKTVPPAPPSVFALGCDGALDEIVLRAIAVDPKRRTPSATALADELASWSASSAPSASTALEAPTAEQVTTAIASVTMPVRTRSRTVPVRTRRVAPVVAAASAAVIVGVGAWWATRDPSVTAVTSSIAMDAGAVVTEPIASAVVSDAGTVEGASDAGELAVPVVDSRERERARPPVKKRVDRAQVEAKLAKLQARAGNAKNPALDKLSAQIADDIAAARYVDANAKLDRALALVR